MKASFRAKANIALIKYWGKSNKNLNLPSTGSISITLDSLYSDTEIIFTDGLDRDYLYIDGKEAISQPYRLSSCLNLIRKEAKMNNFAMIRSNNNFPTASGLASSASGFAAITMAASKALDLNLSKRQLSVIARHGSGSAARSIYGGFVEMILGKKIDGTDSFAKQISPSTHWPLEVVIAITDIRNKKIDSRSAMNLSSSTSPYYKDWVRDSSAELAIAREAIIKKDFEALSIVSQSNCLKMHSVIMTTQPPIVYWNKATLSCIDLIIDLQRSGIPVFFTIDAGPQVKAICEPIFTNKVSSLLKEVSGVKNIIISKLDNSLDIF